MEAGIRVVRGPGWKWGDQDGGEGNVGTVVSPGTGKNVLVQNDSVFVLWDNGQLANYRVGKDPDVQDLLVFDLGPAGIVSGRFKCDECHTNDVGGYRWQCLECGSYNLCDDCYTNEKHNIEHPFLRYDWPSKLDGFPVSARIDEHKRNSVGLFSTARVTRGPDWHYGDQDGGVDKVGRLRRIISIGDCLRGVCEVEWSPANKNNYWIGPEGKMEVIALTPAIGGSYYPHHLAVLNADQLARENVENVSEGAAGNSRVSGSFSVGDMVQVDLEPDVFQAMQEGHGGYFNDMAMLIGRTGVVKERLHTGDIRVQFPGARQPIVINPAALSLASSFKRGDRIRVLSDVDKVKTFQIGHGDWNEHMTPILGAVGKVHSVDGDGDVRVMIGGHKWCLNPKCCTLMNKDEISILEGSDSSSSDDIDSSPEEEVEDPQEHFQHLLHQLSRNTESGLASLSSLLAGRDASRLASLMSGRSSGISADPDSIVFAAATNNERAVLAILEKHPEKVDERNDSCTALQMASVKGHVRVVRMLLDAGADIFAQDKDGDMATHFAVHENRADVLELLIERGADVNLVNFKLLTPLLIAVHKQHLQCTRVLVNHGCDLNCKNPEGNTALNDAVRLMNGDLIAILTAPDSNFNYHSENEDGFNVLQFAALAGNNKAVKVVLSRAPELIDKKKTDGFTPLHMATIKGHKQVAETLLTLGNASIDMKNEKGHTPLMVAVHMAHTPLIELLVCKGADVNASDMLGNTCLHTVLGQWKVGHAIVPQTSNKVQPRRMDDAVEICRVKSELPPETKNRSFLAIACFLLFYGADLRKRNFTGQTPISIVADPAIEDMLRNISQKGGRIRKPLKPVIPSVSDVHECQMCSDVPATVVFLPCGHCVACQGCAERMKKCFICKAVISEKKIQDQQQADVQQQPDVQLYETKECVYRRTKV